MPLPFILTCLVLAHSSSAAAQHIYRYLDENGHPVFSQQPSGNGEDEIIRLTSPNLSKPVIRRTHELLPHPQQPPSDLPYHVVRPQISEDQAIRANGGILEIEVIMEPPLQPDHRLQAVLNGQPVAPPAATQRLKLTELSRGRQRLAIQVVNDQGRVVHETAPVNFSILRHSRLHNASS